MSTKHGVLKCNRPAAAPALLKKPLPMDLLLEIAVRCDVTTIIRCARATKFLRRAIIGPAFRRRLALHAAAGGGGFDPALLFGVSYVAYGACMVPTHHIIDTPSSIQLHALLQLQAVTFGDSFEPVTSRGHLLLLRRIRDARLELRVCDTTTGHVTSLPYTIVWSCAHAFLSVSNAEAGGSYELIVTDKHFRFQTFSSKHGQWDSVREPSFSGHRHRLDMDTSCRVRVIGRTVYCLCRLNGQAGYWDGILALDVDAAEATTMELPPGCLSGIMSCKLDKHLLLASVRGRLSLLVAERCGISMWTLTPASSLQPVATWSRQLIIGKEEIARPVGLVSSSPLSFVLEEFGERSGAVIVRVDRRDLLRLDIGTKVVTRLNNPGDASVKFLFLHETDVVSLIKKSF
jgi:hypothetical protein